MASGFKTRTLGETTRKSNVVVVAKEETSPYLWHKRFGHMSEKGLKILVGKNLLPSLRSYELDLCEHYIYGRKSRVSFMRGGHERKKNLL